MLLTESLATNLLGFEYEDVSPCWDRNKTAKRWKTLKCLLRENATWGDNSLWVPHYQWLLSQWTFVHWAIVNIKLWFIAAWLCRQQLCHVSCVEHYSDEWAGEVDVITGFFSAASRNRFFNSSAINSETWTMTASVSYYSVFEYWVTRILGKGFFFMLLLNPSLGRGEAVSQTWQQTQTPD